MLLPQRLGDFARQEELPLGGCRLGHKSLVGLYSLVATCESRDQSARPLDDACAPLDNNASERSLRADSEPSRSSRHARVLSTVRVREDILESVGEARDGGGTGDGTHRIVLHAGSAYTQRDGGAHTIHWRNRAVLDDLHEQRCWHAALA